MAPVGRGINLATIPEAHKGRGYLEARGYHVGVRTAGLWGKRAKALARRLATSPPAVLAEPPWRPGTA